MLARLRRLSLASKCLLLFGGAIVLTILGAMWGPWLRMNYLVDAGQLDLAREQVDAWHFLDLQSPDPEATSRTLAGITARRLTLEQARAEAPSDAFIARALATFESDRGKTELQQRNWLGRTLEYRFAKGLRKPALPPAAGQAEGGEVAAVAGGELEGIIVLERRPVEATRLLLLNTTLILGFGAFVLAVALCVFHFIAHSLILKPMDDLKQTAERVRSGDLSTRSTIATGDEFEELAQTFNRMLGDLQSTQERLRAVNAALDLKLSEMQESNHVLAQAAKMQGDFLASVSHELRTPLNSIIGFAELLLDIARADQSRLEARAAAGEATQDQLSQISKRVRFLENILSAGRGLLDLINTLLEMARLEAGKVRLQVQRVSLRDLAEGTLGLVQALAGKKGVTLRLEVAPDVPLISTDPRRAQQVLLNFLSNAIKFSEREKSEKERADRPPEVLLRVERLFAGGDAPERVRLSVLDQGPGIAPEMHQKIFERFHQLGGGYSREHSGTGLGLAISKELAALLHGEIQLVSEPGAGAMFSLILPLSLDLSQAAETQLEARFRGALAGRSGWDGPPDEPPPPEPRPDPQPPKPVNTPGIIPDNRVGPIRSAAPAVS
ncbi:MAG: HAMP domain-containing sensor histidine kinase [Planctomycetota bacterium]|nr:HAMP domain-containing sensor histidine kinase [Planctomycetota bacterium]